MTIYRAAWIVPVTASPIPNAAIRIEGDRMLEILRPPFPSPSIVDLGDVAILPGLVNAHTHLELSWLRGRVPPRARFTDWVRDVIRLRRHEDLAVVEPAIVSAIAEMRACGTALVGDVSNNLTSAKPLLASRIGGVVFREAIGFQEARAGEVISRASAELEAVCWTDVVRGGLGAHAPYSVSAAALAAIARQAVANDDVTTVHVAESAEEVAFVKTGSGPWRVLLEELHTWDPSWDVPRCSPVEYLDRLGYLGTRTLAVHGVQATADDLAILQRRGATLVTCPRSNQWTGAGTPPIAAFFESGVRTAIGTDSLASASDLNLFAELAEARRLAPLVPARDLLRAATLNGAEALGFGGEFGSIAPGKRAVLVAVDVPPAVEDVEEYLLDGITPDRVKWVGDDQT